MKKNYSVNTTNSRNHFGTPSRLCSLLLPLLLVAFCLFGVNESACGQTYNGGTWYSLYDTGTDYTSDKTFNVVPPTTEKVTFEWKKSERGLWGSYNGFELNVLYSTDGSNFTGSTRVVTSTIWDKYAPYKEETKTISGSENAVKVKFKYGTCTRTNYFQKVRMPMKKHIWLQKSDGTGVGDKLTKDFEKVKWEQSKGIKINFHSFLTNGNITVTIKGDTNNDFSFSNSSHGVHTLTSSDANKTYAVGSNRCASQNAKKATDYCSSVSTLGNAANYDFTVYFYPKKANVGTSYTGKTVYVEISDGTNTAYVYLQGKVDKRDQTIQNFSTTADTHWTSDAIPAFAAYTTDNTSNQANNLTITYTSSKPQIATVDDNGAVTIKKGGNNNDTQVTLRATQAGNDWYNSTYKEVTYTINKVTPAVTWPTILTGLKYNETCPINTKVEDKWTGGSAVDNKQNPTLDVDGSFTCNDYLLPESNEVGYSVTFTPENTNWYNPKSTTLKQDVEKGDQTITWDLAENQEYTTNTAMTATASSGLTVSYLSNHPEWGYIDANNQLQVVVANKEITITASQDGDKNWNAAEPVTKIIITNGTPPDDWTDVEAESLTYGQLLSESELSGDVKYGTTLVPGTLTWVDATVMPHAGTTNYWVKFTPNNLNAYGSVTFEVPVTVAKATPELTWNIADAVREKATYNQPVVSSNPGTLSVTVSGGNNIARYENGSLIIGELGAAASATVSVRVTQSGTVDFNSIDVTKTITIEPKSTVCVPVVFDAESYKDAYIDVSGTVGWCNTNADGSAKYWKVFDVTYTQFRGIYLGDWTGGTNWNAKYVILAINGVPDRIKFTTKVQTVHAINIDFPETSPAWKIEESSNGVTWTGIYEGNDQTMDIDQELVHTTRYVKITYSGNFTGYLCNLEITRQHYLNTDKDELVFGTATNPLQEPQELLVSYASIGSCENPLGTISVSSTNSAFYADVTSFNQNVDFDQFGSYKIRVRCNDVNQSGTLVFTTSDGLRKEVSVRSTNPTITSAGSNIFQTGSEHATEENAAYRAIGTHDFASCFSGTTALFDTLYIYGVTESAARAWELDANKGYGVPAFTVTDGATAGTAYTPCFVFAKSGNEYVYNRTFDATNKSLAINAEGKRLWFAGYKTVSSTTVQPAIAVSGSADIYLSNVEMNACGAVLTTSNAATVTVHARGTNNLNVTGNASAVALDADNTSALVVEDSWLTENVGVLNLNGAAGLPTVNLGNASNSLTINGAQVTLKNGTRMAVAYLSDGVEQVQGAVHINDGTILGESVLGLPARTSIDGGTFNDGTVRVYTRQGGNGSMPRNTEGELLARRMMAIEEVPAGYGKAHLIPDGNLKVYPMLLNENVYEYNEEDGTWETTTKWNHDSKPGKEDIVVISKNVTVNTEVKIASLTIEDGGSLTIEDGGVVVLVQDGYDQLECASYGNLIVKKGGRFETNNNRFEVKDFYIESALGPIDGSATSAKSGQVTDATALVVDGDAYFDLILDQSGRCSAGWYDFSVPFPVDNRTGISRFQNGAWKTDLQTEQHYAIMTYHEEIRAKGEYGWKKYYGIMQPGVCYTITVNNTAPLYRFRKVANAPIEGNHQIPLQVSNGLGDDTNKGWNCIGNSTLSHASVWADNSVSKVQIYDHASNTYTAFDQYETAHLPVGTAIFVQVLEASNMHFDEVVSYAAPQRVQGRTLDEYLLTFTAENNTFVDKLYLSASEDAENSYQIGHDLVKFGTSTTVAQIWADAYGQKLCDVEAPLVNDQAIIPISLYAPGTDSYTLDVVRGPQDASLYLMYNGAVIWNLSQSAYTFDLTRGTNSAYSLLLTAEAPSVTTGVDAVQSETKSVEKIILNGNLYILRDGEMYDATGKKVK